MDEPLDQLKNPFPHPLVRPMFYLYGFSLESSLAKRCLRTHGRILRYTKYQFDWEPGKS